MTTIAQTLAGSTLRVSAALPATYDAAGFGALSYTVVAEVTDLGSGLGRKYGKVTHEPVNDRQIYKFKTNYDNGTLALKMARSTATTTDAGQTLLTAAVNSDADYSFKITLQDGSDLFFSAKVMSFTADLGTGSNILTATAELEVNSAVIETT